MKEKVKERIEKGKALLTNKKKCRRCKMLKTLEKIISKMDEEWERMSLTQRANDEDFRVIYKFAKEAKSYEDFIESLSKYDEENDSYLLNTYYEREE